MFTIYVSVYNTQPPFTAQICGGKVWIIHGERWYVNVTRHPVLVYTDHNPLVFFERMKLKNPKILRWSLLIQSYNLEINHIKGKNNVIANALSPVG